MAAVGGSDAIARPRGAGDRPGASQPFIGQRARVLPRPREAGRAPAHDGRGGSQSGRRQRRRRVAPGARRAERERDAGCAICRHPAALGRDRCERLRERRPRASTSRRARAVQPAVAGAYAVATRSVPARSTIPSTARESPSLALRRSSASVAVRRLRVVARDIQLAVRRHGSGRVHERAVEHAAAAETSRPRRGRGSRRRRRCSAWRPPPIAISWARSSGAASASTGPVPVSTDTSSEAPASTPMWCSAGIAGQGE